MTISVGQHDNMRRGAVAKSSLLEDRAAQGKPDVYVFELVGSEEQLTISVFPYERFPVAGDSVLVFLHEQFPTHAASCVFDVPESVTP